MEHSTKLQAWLAIASFASGVTIACICLFAIPPLGEISNSAISFVTELLILCGAILGVKVNYDLKFQNFRNEILSKVEKEVKHE